MSEAAVDTLRSDPVLEPLINEHGPVRLEPAEQPFERLIVSITNQQLSGASAAAIRERLFDRFEITPEALAVADPAELTDTGLSRQKTQYVQHAAEAFIAHGYDVEYFEEMSDEAVIEELTEIRGIGRWTGKMFLMFCLAREDVFPVEDLGIRRGMEALFGADITRTEMVDRAERWRPYRSYASLYLWRTVD